jgi:EAL domain-containing protein (putative c-di-GMP-specific phosphodiesterase class I)
MTSTRAYPPPSSSLWIDGSLLWLEVDLKMPIPENIHQILHAVWHRIEAVFDEGEQVFARIQSTFWDSDKVTQIISFIRDHHGTFGLFHKRLHHAANEVKKDWLSQMSVPLYLHDIRHPDFQSTMQELVDQWIPTKKMILEIQSDDYGVLDSVALCNLEFASKECWLNVSVHDLTLEWDQIKSDKVEKITSKGIFPAFILTSKSVIQKIRTWWAKTTNTFKEVLEKIHSKWWKLIDAMTGKSEILPPIYKEAPDSFRPKNVEKEPIKRINGDTYAEELLARFGENIEVDMILQEIIKHGYHRSLLRHMLRTAKSDLSQRDCRLSVNLFLKNLALPTQDLKDDIRAVMAIPKEQRKNLIFELTEYRYGVMSEQVIRNLEFLREEGFSIALDDLWGKEDGQSREVYEMLTSYWYTFDYIKIDGEDCLKILDGTINIDQLSYLQWVIKAEASRKYPPIIVVESIQDTSHAIMVYKTLCSSDVDPEHRITMIFQWQKLKDASFGINKAQKSQQ